MIWWVLPWGAGLTHLYVRGCSKLSTIFFSQTYWGGGGGYTQFRYGKRCRHFFSETTVGFASMSRVHFGHLFNKWHVKSNVAYLKCAMKTVFQRWIATMLVVSADRRYLETKCNLAQNLPDLGTIPNTYDRPRQGATDTKTQKSASVCKCATHWRFHLIIKGFGDSPGHTKV